MTNSTSLRILGGCVVVLGIAGVAQTATVELFLTALTHSDEWTLYASSSLGDNAGIAGFFIDLDGLGASGTAIANAPKGLDLDDVAAGVKGFNIGNGDDAGDSVTLFAVQGGAGELTADLPTVIFGVGQTPGTFNFLSGSEVGVPWDAPVLLAFGAKDPGAWMDFGDSASVNVLSEEGSVTVEGAEVVLTIVPEPSTFALAALVFLAVLCPMFRTRHSRA